MSAPIVTRQSILHQREKKREAYRKGVTFESDRATRDETREASIVKRSENESVNKGCEGKEGILRQNVAENINADTLIGFRRLTGGMFSFPTSSRYSFSPRISRQMSCYLASETYAASSKL